LSESGHPSGRSTAVIIPVKAADPKKRLSSVLDPRGRRQLQVAMLEDTLQTLIRARMIGHTFVVSSDREVLGFAERFGARSIFEEGDAGVNSAVNRGLDRTAHYDKQMVIPADLPLLAVEDLKAGPMLAREGAQVVISPSETFDGTNMLLVTPGVGLPLHYDDDSFRKHFASATARRLRVVVYYSRGVGFDVDRPSDLHRFFRYKKPGNTLTFLGRTLRREERARQRSR
jgi:2-phospho-L-lactate guanylyltransferase